MWRIRNMSRASYLSQHKRFLHMQMQKRIRRRWRGVRWRRGVQTAEKHTTDHNDRGRSWRRCTVNYCLDSVLLLCKKAQEGGRRRKSWKNGVYSISIRKWLGKLWFWWRRVWLKQEDALFFKFGCYGNRCVKSRDWFCKKKRHRKIVRLSFFSLYRTFYFMLKKIFLYLLFFFVKNRWALLTRKPFSCCFCYQNNESFE